MPYYPSKRPGPEEDPDRVFREKPREKPALRFRAAWRRIGIAASTAVALYGLIRLGIYGGELLSQRRLAAELRELNRTEEPASPESGAGIPETASGTPDVSASGSPSAAPKASVSPAPSPVPAGTAEGRLPEIRYPENDPPMLRERFIPLRKKSKYIMGWLRAGDTVDLAVVQKDNEWFLTRDASGRRNANGALFLDERISLRTRPYTLVIYGHNMKSGEMFGRLQHFRDSAYFYRHRMLTFDTIYEDGRYIAFAAGELSLIPGTNHYVDFGALFSTRTESRRQGIAQLRLASDCIGAASVEPEDQLLILVTCTSDDDHRTFLAARRLREGEPEDALLLQEGDGDAS